MKNKLKVIAYTVGRSDFERFLPILNILKGKKNVKLEIVPSYIHYLSFFGSTIQNIKKKFSVVSSPNYKNTSFNLQDNPKYLASMVSSEIKKISDIFKKKDQI